MAESASAGVGGRDRRDAAVRDEAEGRGEARRAGLAAERRQGDRGRAAGGVRPVAAVGSVVPGPRSGETGKLPPRHSPLDAGSHCAELAQIIHHLVDQQRRVVVRRDALARRGTSCSRRRRAPGSRAPRRDSCSPPSSGAPGDLHRRRCGSPRLAFDRSNCTAMPETCGKRPLRARQQRQAVLHRALQLGAGNLDHHHAVVERQLGQNVALR